VTTALTGWKPSTYIKHYLKRNVLDYLFVTNADLDHISDLNNLWKEGITVSTFFRNRSVSPEVMRIIKEASGELDRGHRTILGHSCRLRLPLGRPLR
jgi:mRNA degradation ribonuclease J1/J2